MKFVLKYILKSVYSYGYFFKSFIVMLFQFYILLSKTAVSKLFPQCIFLN